MVCLFFCSMRVFAFSLTPMSVDFAPFGKDATRSFILDNQSSEKIAVQLSVVERKIDDHGVEKNTEVEDDFSVYPPQLVLSPGEKRTVRLTWQSKKEVTERELAYRLIAEQLPVLTEKPEKKGALIRMLLKYEAALYVTPVGAKAEIVLEEARLLNEKKMQLTLANRGGAHQVLKNIEFNFNGIFKGKIKSLEGQNILAGKKRIFDVEFETPIQMQTTFPKVVQGRFEFK